MLLVWLVYSRVDHYLLADRVEALEQKSKALDDSLARTKKAPSQHGRSRQVGR